MTKANVRNAQEVAEAFKHMEAYSRTVEEKKTSVIVESRAIGEAVEQHKSG